MLELNSQEFCSIPSGETLIVSVLTYCEGHQVRKTNVDNIKNKNFHRLQEVKIEYSMICKGMRRKIKFIPLSSISEFSFLRKDTYSTENVPLLGLA